jgi:hypothetical protein
MKDIWKRSSGETEIVIKVPLLCEMRTVDMSIEDSGSMFGKEVTRLSHRIFNNSVKKIQSFCVNEVTLTNDGFVWFRRKRPL